MQPSGVYDGEGARGATGLGEDARAVIDRAPLDVRLALACDPRLPAKIRLDLALTSYGRAVQLQDPAAVDAAARLLVPLLPPMAGPFRGVLEARPGADKRFAEFLVLAMIPGVRVDLADYVRPEGRRSEDYKDRWTDWLIPPRPERGAAPPALAAYQETGTGYARYTAGLWPDALSDLSCMGECGRGGRTARHAALPAGLRGPGRARARLAPQGRRRLWAARAARPVRRGRRLGRHAGLRRSAPDGPAHARGAALAGPRGALRRKPSALGLPRLPPAARPLPRLVLGA